MAATADMIEIRPDPAELASMREFVRRQATACGLSEAETFHACLVATEAVTNAIRHGTRPGSDDPIRVSCGLGANGFEVEVGDNGGLVAFREESEEHLAEPYDGGGRGLGLMRRLTRSLDMETSINGTRMRALLGPHVDEFVI
jgi:anti-sigma regulatory factor (Ser/Thr protein kinase)